MKLRVLTVLFSNGGLKRFFSNKNTNVRSVAGWTDDNYLQKSDTMDLVDTA